MRHYIIVKWKPEVSAEQKTAMVPEIRTLFEKTLEIPGIHEIHVDPNVVDRSNRYDLMIEMVMEPEALVPYDNCPWHHEWKDTYSQRIDKKTIFDRA